MSRLLDHLECVMTGRTIISESRLPSIINVDVATSQYTDITEKQVYDCRVKIGSHVAVRSALDLDHAIQSTKNNLANEIYGEQRDLVYELEATLLAKGFMDKDIRDKLNELRDSMR